MNKNWFYKVLALVLVAMLALPMFALAEETDVVVAASDPELVENDDVVAGDVEDAGDEAEDAEAGESDLGDAVSKTWWVDEEGENLLYVDLASRKTQEYDIAVDGEDVFAYGGALFQIYVDNAKAGTEPTFKSSNSRIAAVGYDGSLAVFRPGKVTITVRGYIDGRKSKVSVKMKLNITDKDAVHSMTLYVGPSDELDPDPTAVEFSSNTHASGDTVNVFVGEAMIYEGEDFNPVEASDYTEYVLYPFLYSEGEDLIDYYPAGLTWKWSNAKVAFFDPRVETPPFVTVTADGAEILAKDRKPFKASGKYYGFEQLTPVFYKSGKSTLTFKAPAVAGNKAMSYKINFNVKANKVDHLTPYGDKYLQSLAEQKDLILYAIDSIDIQTVDKVVVKMKIYNGTNWSASSLKKPHLEIMSNQGEREEFGTFVKYGQPDEHRNNKVKGSIKKKKTSTITFTLINKRDKWFKLLEDSGKYTTEIIAPWQNFNPMYMNMFISDFGFEGLGMNYLESVGAAAGMPEVDFD